MRFIAKGGALKWAAKEVDFGYILLLKAYCKIKIKYYSSLYFLYSFLIWALLQALYNPSLYKRTTNLHFPFLLS